MRRFDTRVLQLMADNPDVPLALSNLAARGLDTGGGLWVSTGAITGVHKVVPGAQVTATFGSHGAVQCRIAAAKGQ